MIGASKLSSKSIPSGLKMPSQDTLCHSLSHVDPTRRACRWLVGCGSCADLSRGALNARAIARPLAESVGRCRALVPEVLNPADFRRASPAVLVWLPGGIPPPLPAALALMGEGPTHQVGQTRPGQFTNDIADDLAAHNSLSATGPQNDPRTGHPRRRRSSAGCCHYQVCRSDRHPWCRGVRQR